MNDTKIKFIQDYTAPFNFEDYEKPLFSEVNFSNPNFQEFMKAIDIEYGSLRNFIMTVKNLDLLIPFQTENEFKIFNRNIHSEATRRRKKEGQGNFKIKTMKLNNLQYVISFRL